MRTPPWAWRLASGAALILGLAAAAGPAGPAQAAIRPPCCRVLLRSAVVEWGSGAAGDQGLPGDVVQVSGGDFESLFLTSDGHVWISGLTGLADDVSHVPELVPGLAGITQVAAGDDTNLALRSDGTVWGWGANTDGELGTGNYTPSKTLVQVTGLTGVTQIAMGFRWALALRSDGTVWSWGSNDRGQLGDGTTSDRLVPVQVQGLSRVTRIAAGYQEGMAVARRGVTTLDTVYTWGDNSAGQIGDGTYQQRPVPVPITGIGVPSVGGVAGIAAGGTVGQGFAMVLGTDGTLWDWGANGSGQLGNGATNVVIRPAEARGLDSGITQISAGGAFALALHSDGTVWAWGSSDGDELGTNPLLVGPVPAPVRVTGLVSVTQVAAARYFALAIEKVPVISAPGAAAPAGAAGARS
jgi:hypothetical protein